MATDRPARLPDRIVDDAIRRHARAREPGASAAELARWLAADPRHRQAYDEAERLWALAAAPVARVLAEGVAPSAPSRIRAMRPLRMAMAASLLLMLVGGGYVWGHDLVDDLRSDYVTAIGERHRLTLADGSAAVLNTNSALAVDIRPDRRGVRLFRGEAWFEVADLDAYGPFVITTPQGSLELAGGRLNVRVDDDRVTISMAEGDAMVATTHTPVAHGQQVTLGGPEPVTRPSFDLTAVTGWLRGQIVFYDAPLHDVVAELGRYRRGVILVTNDELDRLGVSGVFDASDPDAAIAVIDATLPVRVTRLTDYLIVIR